jgi:hypothetical protein
MTRLFLAFAFVLALLVPNAAMAQSRANPQAAGSNGSFKVVAVLTTDPRAPAQAAFASAPKIAGVPSLKLGQSAYLLVAFTGAEAKNGVVNLACTVTIRQPNGKTTALRPTACFARPLGGPASAYYTVDVAAGMQVEPGDPSGLWVFNVRVTDRTTGEGVRLKVSTNVDSGG